MYIEGMPLDASDGDSFDLIEEINEFAHLLRLIYFTTDFVLDFEFYLTISLPMKVGYLCMRR